MDASLCAREPLCQDCVSCCPMDILTRPQGKTAQMAAENEDECIPYNLCLDRCPVDAVSLVKLY